MMGTLRIPEGHTDGQTDEQMDNLKEKKNTFGGEA